jgi:hypothetical protein
MYDSQHLLERECAEHLLRRESIPGRMPKPARSGSTFNYNTVEYRYKEAIADYYDMFINTVGLLYQYF